MIEAPVQRNTFKALAPELKPREQMKMAAHSSELTNEALLSILLKTGANGCDVMELSRRLITAFGSLEALMRCEWRELKESVRRYNKEHPDSRISGLGEVKLLELGAAFELARRAERSSHVAWTALLDARDCAKMLLSEMRSGDDQENLWLVPLDAKSMPLCRPFVVARGAYDRMVLNTRDVLKEVVRKSGCQFIVAHNHPSGELEPSFEDIQFTRQLLDAARVLGLRFIDHIILSPSKSVLDERFLSLRERNIVAFDE